MTPRTSISRTRALKKETGVVVWRPLDGKIDMQCFAMSSGWGDGCSQRLTKHDASMFHEDMLFDCSIVIPRLYGYKHGMRYGKCRRGILGVTQRIRHH